MWRSRKNSSLIWDRRSSHRPVRLQCGARDSDLGIVSEMLADDALAQVMSGTDPTARTKHNTLLGYDLPGEEEDELDGCSLETPDGRRIGRRRCSGGDRDLRAIGRGSRSLERRILRGIEQRREG